MVERIRIDPPPACRRRANCPHEPLYVYVDPETFYPVAFDRTDTQVEIIGGPEAPLLTVRCEPATSRAT
jgi:hypothetical protein